MTGREGFDHRTLEEKTEQAVDQGDIKEADEREE